MTYPPLGSPGPQPWQQPQQPQQPPQQWGPPPTQPPYGS